MNLRPNPIAIAAAALALACALPAYAAGPVDVSFLPDWRQYTDPGRDPADAVRNEETLARHLQSLGTRWLAEGQQLKIDVLDVDLSGSLRPARRAAIDEVRISRRRTIALTRGIRTAPSASISRVVPKVRQSPAPCATS